MFCGNCGAQIPDGTVYCPECGGKQDGAAVNNTNNASPVNEVMDKVKSVGKNKLIGIGAVAVVVVILLVVIFGGESANSVAKKTTKYLFKGELVKMVKLLPDDVIDAMVEEDGYDSKKEFFEDGEDIEEEYKDMLDEYDIKFKSCKIKDEEDYKNKEVNELEDMYEEDLDVDLNIKKAKTIEVEVEIKVDGEVEEMDMELTVIKVGGSWYLDYNSMESLMYSAEYMY